MDTEDVKKKKSSFLLILFLFLIILGLCGYILYDKGIIFNDKDNKSNNDSNIKDKNDNKSNDKIEYKIVTDNDSNQKLFVNGNEVVIPIKHEIKEINKVDIIDDILIADIWIPDSTSLFAINKEGKVIWFEYPAGSCNKVYGNACVEVVGDNYAESFGYEGSYYKINGNKITFVSMYPTQDPEWSVCQLKGDDIFEAEYEVEYLGNDKFSKLKILKSTTADEYIENNHIACIQYET